MAEIKVERKRRNLLPLLLGLLVLLVLLWWFLSRNGTDDSVATTPADTTAMTPGAAAGTGATVGAMNDSGGGALASDSTAGATTGATTGAAMGAAGTALGDYVTFIGNTSAQRTEDEQHEYAAGGIRRLATALEAMNPGGAARAQLGLMRQKADSLQITSTGSDRHADMARAAFDAASEVIARLPGASGASAQVAAVRQAAGALAPGRHMLEQKDQIQAFFEAARDALRAMSGTGTA